MVSEDKAQELMLQVILQSLNENLEAIKNHHKSFKGKYRETLKLMIEDFRNNALKILES